MISSGAYDAARRKAAFLDRSEKGRILVMGSDRVAFLHGLLTNDIASLNPGQGCYAAYLTPQGRMITDVWVYVLDDKVLLTVGSDVKDTMLTRLDQLIFTEDVQVTDGDAAFAGMAIVGPDSARVVGTLVKSLPLEKISALPEHGSAAGEFLDGTPVLVIRITDTGEPGYDVLTDLPHASTLGPALTAQQIVRLDRASAEALRIESGVPRFHTDMDEETIPLEAGIESQAISMTKGCYVGQEVIVRILHRGHGRIARKLVGLLFDGAVAPEPHSPVLAGGREAGHVTSSVLSPSLDRAIAMAYVHRDLFEAGTRVTVAGMEGRVTSLPFERP